MHEVVFVHVQCRMFPTQCFVYVYDARICTMLIYVLTNRRGGVSGAQCDLCSKGNYCPGASSAALSCGDGLTTLTEGARSVDQCGKFLSMNMDSPRQLQWTALLCHCAESAYVEQLKPSPICLQTPILAYQFRNLQCQLNVVSSQDCSQFMCCPSGFNNHESISFVGAMDCVVKAGRQLYLELNYYLSKQSLT